AVALIAEHPNELVRDQYLMQVADRCRVEPARLRELAAHDARRQPRGEPVLRTGDRAPNGGPRPLPAGGPELAALRLAVHRPEEMASRLDALLFAHPLARAAFEALLSATTFHEAVESADPQSADLLQVLAVQESDADADDVMIRLVERAGNRALEE